MKLRLSLSDVAGKIWSIVVTLSLNECPRFF
jgi:hypothetical protein